MLSSIRAFSLTLAAIALAPILARADGPRRETVLADGWRFLRVEKTDPADRAPADSAPWTTVTIPHNYGWQQAQAGKRYERGPAWYKRVVEIPADAKDRRVFLKFEAASAVAEVRFNGKPLGEHRGAFGAFAFEVTNFAKPGEANTLEVRTDNSVAPDVAPLSGDFCVFGGIYRPVHLIVTDEVCITPLDHASPGVAILQTKVSAAEAVLDISTQISYLAARENRRTTMPKLGLEAASTRHDAPNSAKRSLSFSLLDADGGVVASDEREIHIQPLETPSYGQRVVVKNPRLWQGRADPYLYRAVIELKKDGVVTDRVTQPVGLRSFRIDPEKGFFLNDKPLKVLGVCRHQDREGKGWAISPEDEKEDLDLITGMGANAIRCAHYQHSENFYRLCDEAGVLVWAELPNVDQIGADGKFAATNRAQLLDLIRQNINHPSIFTWCLFNEVRPTSPDPHALIADLHRLARAEDPTRPTIGAASHNWWPEMNRITDWLGFNTYPFWYTGNNPGKLFDERKGIPRIPAYCISEYGVGASMWQHMQGMTLRDQPSAGGKWHPEEWQTFAHERVWKAVKERDFVWGSFLWNMFDFCSWSRTEGDRDGINDKGMVTYDRTGKKDTYFFYRANWSDEPVLYITSRRHVRRGEAKTPVHIYSNVGPAELKVNGVSLGTVTPDDLRIADFAGVTLCEGKNTVEVTAVRAGKTFVDSCEWEYIPRFKELRGPSGDKTGYGEKAVGAPVN